MKDSSLFGIGALNALGVLVYVAAVAWLLTHAEEVFGEVQSFLAPMAVLLLFVFSATVAGLLILGRPAWLYLAGEKRAGVSLLLITLGWLGIGMLAQAAVLIAVS